MKQGGGRREGGGTRKLKKQTNVSKKSEHKNDAQTSQKIVSNDQQYIANTQRKQINRRTMDEGELTKRNQRLMKIKINLKSISECQIKIEANGHPSNAVQINKSNPVQNHNESKSRLWC